MATLILVFKRIGVEDKPKCGTFYSHSNAETVTVSYIDDNLFRSIYTTVISDMQIFSKRCRLDYLYKSQSIILTFQSITP